jgi:hypothetical protein
MQFTLRGATHLRYSFRAALLRRLPDAAVPRLNMQLLHASRSMTSSDAIEPSRLDSTSGRHNLFPSVFIRVYMRDIYFGCWV